MSRKATGELKNVQAGACQVFLRGVSFRHRADATGVKAPARHPSQCSDPRFRCSMGDVSSTIASSTLPPGRLIVRVLSSGCEASRATPRHAERSHQAHHSHAGRNNFEKQNGQHRSGRCVDGSGSSLTRIVLQRQRFVDRWQRPLRRPWDYEAFEARHCMRRLTPATLGVHLRDLFAMNRNKQRFEY